MNQKGPRVGRQGDSPRRLLERYGLRPKKSWGQNFLVDPNAYARIVAAAAIDRTTCVVEIGAGLGTLTRALAAESGRTIAIERDRDLAVVLRQEFMGFPDVEIVEADAARFDYGEVSERAGASRVVVVGNIPYQIATPILLRLVQARRRLSHAVLMLQHEMAKRLVARPGTKDYGALNLAVSTYARVSWCFAVSRRAFLPQPRVDSAVIRIDFQGRSETEPRDPGLYEKLVRTAFSQRRKMLRNALEKLVPIERLGPLLDHAGVSRNARAEELSCAAFVQLADEIAGQGGLNPGGGRADDA